MQQLLLYFKKLNNRSMNKSNSKMAKSAANFRTATKREKQLYNPGMTSVMGRTSTQWNQSTFGARGSSTQSAQGYRTLLREFLQKDLVNMLDQEGLLQPRTGNARVILRQAQEYQKRCSSQNLYEHLRGADAKSRDGAHSPGRSPMRIQNKNMTHIPRQLLESSQRISVGKEVLRKQQPDKPTPLSKQSAVNRYKFESLKQEQIEASWKVNAPSSSLQIVRVEQPQPFVNQATHYMNTTTGFGQRQLPRRETHGGLAFNYNEYHPINTVTNVQYFGVGQVDTRQTGVPFSGSANFKEFALFATQTSRENQIENDSETFTRFELRGVAALGVGTAMSSARGEQNNGETDEVQNVATSESVSRPIHGHTKVNSILSNKLWKQLEEPSGGSPEDYDQQSRNPAGKRVRSVDDTEVPVTDIKINSELSRKRDSDHYGNDIGAQQPKRLIVDNIQGRLQERSSMQRTSNDLTHHESISGLVARGEFFPRGSRHEGGNSNSLGSLRKDNFYQDEAAKPGISAIKSTKRAFHVNIDAGISVRPCKQKSKEATGRDSTKFKSAVSPNLDLVNELDTAIKKQQYGAVIVREGRVQVAGRNGPIDRWAAGKTLTNKHQVAVSGISASDDKGRLQSVYQDGAAANDVKTDTTKLVMMKSADGITGGIQEVNVTTEESIQESQPNKKIKHRAGTQALDGSLDTCEEPAHSSELQFGIKRDSTENRKVLINKTYDGRTTDEDVDGEEGDPALHTNESIEPRMTDMSKFNMNQREMGDGTQEAGGTGTGNYDRSYFDNVDDDRLLQTNCEIAAGKSRSAESSLIVFGESPTRGRRNRADMYAFHGCIQAKDLRWIAKLRADSKQRQQIETLNRPTLQANVPTNSYGNLPSVVTVARQSEAASVHRRSIECIGTINSTVEKNGSNQTTNKFSRNNSIDRSAGEEQPDVAISARVLPKGRNKGLDLGLQNSSGIGSGGSPATPIRHRAFGMSKAHSNVKDQNMDMANVLLSTQNIRTASKNVERSQSLAEIILNSENQATAKAKELSPFETGMIIRDEADQTQGNESSVGKMKKVYVTQGSNEMTSSPIIVIPTTDRKASYDVKGSPLKVFGAESSGSFTKSPKCVAQEQGSPTDLSVLGKLSDGGAFQIELKRASSADPDDRTAKRLQEAENGEKSLDITSAGKEPLLVEITKNGFPTDILLSMHEVSSSLVNLRERVVQDKPPRMMNIPSPIRQHNQQSMLQLVPNSNMKNYTQPRSSITPDINEDLLGQPYENYSAQEPALIKAMMSGGGADSYDLLAGKETDSSVVLVSSGFGQTSSKLDNYFGNTLRIPLLQGGMGRAPHTKPKTQAGQRADVQRSSHQKRKDDNQSESNLLELQMSGSRISLAAKQPGQRMAQHQVIVNGGSNASSGGPVDPTTGLMTFCPSLQQFKLDDQNGTQVPDTASPTNSSGRRRRAQKSLRSINQTGLNGLRKIRGATSQAIKRPSRYPNILAGDASIVNLGQVYEEGDQPMLIKEERSMLSKRGSEPAARRTGGAGTVLEKNTTAELLAYAASLGFDHLGQAYQTHQSSELQISENNPLRELKDFKFVNSDRQSNMNMSFGVHSLKDHGGNGKGKPRPVLNDKGPQQLPYLPQNQIRAQPSQQLRAQKMRSMRHEHVAKVRDEISTPLLPQNFPKTQTMRGNDLLQDVNGQNVQFSGHRTFHGKSQMSRRQIALQQCLNDILTVVPVNQKSIYSGAAAARLSAYALSEKISKSIRSRTTAVQNNSTEFGNIDQQTN